MRKAVRIFRALGASSRATSASSRSSQASGRWMPNRCSMNPATRFAQRSPQLLQRQLARLQEKASHKRAIDFRELAQRKPGSRAGSMSPQLKRLRMLVRSRYGPPLAGIRESGGALVSKHYLTSCNLPVATSKIAPRTATSLEIQGCDLTFLICSRVFCSGSL